MKITTDKINYLKKGFSIANSLIVEGTISFSDGVKLKSIDPAGVCMIDLHILKNIFSKFEASDDNITLSMKDFYETLSLFDVKEVVNLEEVDNKFIVSCVSAKKKKSFKLPIIDADVNKDHNLSVDYKTEVVISMNILNDALHAANKIGSDTLTIGLENEKLIFYAENGQRNYLQEHSINKVIENAKARYSLSYLEKIAKMSSISDKVRIKVKNDCPITFSVRVPDVMSLKMFLAPIVDNDD